MSSPSEAAKVDTLNLASLAVDLIELSAADEPVAGDTTAVIEQKLANLTTVELMTVIVAMVQLLPRKPTPDLHWQIEQLRFLIAVGGWDS